MRAIEARLAPIFSESFSFVHGTRRRTLFWAVANVLKGASLTVTSIGRGGDGAPKHDIKRADRLLSNKRLHGEMDGLMTALVRLVVGSLDRVAIAIDWTDLDKHHGDKLLVAAVIHDGRALPVMWAIAGDSGKGSNDVESDLLGRLANALPDGAHATLLVDAGFRGPFIQCARRHGFDVIARASGRQSVATDGESWQPVNALVDGADQTVQDIGMADINATPSLRFNARVVRARAPRKSPPRKRRGARPAGAATTKAIARNRNAPLLVTTMDSATPAETIVEIYGKRMQIEETFRDMKSPRFAWGMNFGRFLATEPTTRHQRQHVLLLIGALAQLAAHVIGIAAEAAGLHRSCQANTLARRSLSLRSLAVAVLAKPGLRARLRPRDIAFHFKQLKNALREVVADV